jgi:hypothetical protein
MSAFEHNSYGGWNMLSWVFLSLLQLKSIGDALEYLHLKPEQLQDTNLVSEEKMSTKK